MDTRLKVLAVWRRQQWVLQLLRSHAGAEIFIVGGAVRDALLGRPTKDFDFVVRNVPKPALEKFLARYGNVSLVGKRFGVFKFVPIGWHGTELDIALPRTEHVLAGTGAYKDFKVSSNASLKIADDLSRRDFTINAMAFNVATGELIDPFSGTNDLTKKIIRTVGAPAERFKEDYSRMLRAVRFAAQLDFKIEKKCWAVIKKTFSQINRTADGERIVPFEVIAKELHNALVAAPVYAMELLDESGAIRTLMPELLKMKKCPQPKMWHSEGDVWTHTLLALKELNGRAFAKEFASVAAHPDIVWATLFHDIGKPYTMTKIDRIRFNGHDVQSAKLFRTVAERLRLASAGVNVDDVERIIARHMILTDSTIKNIKPTTLEKYFFSDLFPGEKLLMLLFVDVRASLTASGKPGGANYRLLKRKLGALGGNQKRSLPAPLLSGNDVMRILSVKSGPHIGEVLTILREAQLSKKIKTKKNAERFIRKMQ